MPSPVPFPTRLSLPEDVRAAAVGRLNQRLADAIDLTLQAKQAHWNIKGPLFGPLHALFDAVHDTAEDVADELAERVAQLGGAAQGTLQMATAATSLSPAPEIAPATGWLTQLATACATLANGIRDDIDASTAEGDQVTANLLADLGQRLDAQCWKIDAHTIVIDA
jgi:starvation-inducible DNA-binding protein